MVALLLLAGARLAALLPASCVLLTAYFSVITAYVLPISQTSLLIHHQAPDYLALKAAFLEHIAAGRPGTPAGVVDLDGALACTNHLTTLTVLTTSPHRLLPTYYLLGATSPLTYYLLGATSLLTTYLLLTRRARRAPPGRHAAARAA